MWDIFLLMYFEAKKKKKSICICKTTRASRKSVNHVYNLYLSNAALMSSLKGVASALYCCCSVHDQSSQVEDKVQRGKRVGAKCTWREFHRYESSVRCRTFGMIHSGKSAYHKMTCHTSKNWYDTTTPNVYQVVIKGTFP